MKQQILWVVEIKEGGIFVPTVGAYLSRATARHQLSCDWKKCCPNEKFRIAKYIREA